MENLNEKIVISIAEQYVDLEGLKEFRKIFSSYEVAVDSHSLNSGGYGGDYTVFWGILIGYVGNKIIDNVFNDLYDVVKSKLFKIYKKIKKDRKNKAKVLNFILKSDGVILMFIFELGLSFNDFDYRYASLKNNYNKYFKQFEGGDSNYPVVFFWDNKKSEWKADVRNP